MKKFLLIIIFIAINSNIDFNILNAQVTVADSLKMQLAKSISEKDRMSKLLNLAEYLTINNQDSAEYYAEILKNKSIEQKDDNFLFWAYFYILEINFNTENYESLQNYINEALNHFKGSQYVVYRANLLGAIAERMREKLHFDASINYWSEAVNLKLDIKSDSEFKYKSYSRMAATYYEMKDFNNAKKCIHTSFLFKPKEAQYIPLINNYELLGALKRDEKQFAESIDNFNKALEICKQYSDSSAMPNLFANIAKIFLDQQKYSKAIEYALQSYKIAIKFNQNNVLLLAAEYLALSYSGIGNFEEAYKYLTINKTGTSNQFNQEHDEAIAKLNAKYELLKKSDEIQNQKIKLQKKKNENILLFSCIVISLFVLGYVIITRRKLKKINAILITKNEEINSQTIALAESYRKLEDLAQFKKNMTSMIVHDLKNPVSIILNTEPEDKCSKSFIAIQQYAKTILNLVMNLLDVNKYENSSMIVNAEELELYLTIVNACDEINLLAEKKNIHFKLSGIKGIYVKADREILHRIFVNLFTNSIKYSPLNSFVTISVHTLYDGLAEIQVSDEGEGIEENQTESVFQQYNQYSARSSGGISSTGLGLTFCKMAVEAHGGKIGVRNKPEKGCEFWFSIPLTSKINVVEENENIIHDYNSLIQFSETDYEILKEVVKQIKEFEIYEISRFHEVLTPLVDTAGNNVNKWITLLFSAINIQNIDEFNRLISLAENEQTKNTDCR